MSTSDLYAVFRKSTRHLSEYRNGWGSAPILWDYLCRTYLGRETWSFMGENKDLWQLASDQRVPLDLRLAHAFTFDGTFCPRSRAKELGASLQRAGRKVAVTDRVNHWFDIGADLLANGMARAQGFALSCTSVNDVWCEWKGGDLSDVFSITEVK